MSGQNTSAAFHIPLAHSKAPDLVLGAGIEIAFNSEGGGAADWIMLLPIDSAGLVPTKDGRGPYRVADAAKLAASALSAHSGRERFERLNVPQHARLDRSPRSRRLISHHLGRPPPVQCAGSAPTCRGRVEKVRTRQEGRV